MVGVYALMVSLSNHEPPLVLRHAQDEREAVPAHLRSW